MARHYAPEFKQEAVALVAAGHAVKAVASELGLPQHTLWG
jgi:transposase-like protein